MTVTSPAALRSSLPSTPPRAAYPAAELHVTNVYGRHSVGVSRSGWPHNTLNEISRYKQLPCG